MCDAGNDRMAAFVRVIANFLTLGSHRRTCFDEAFKTLGAILTADRVEASLTLLRRHTHHAFSARETKNSDFCAAQDVLNSTAVADSRRFNGIHLCARLLNVIQRYFFTVFEQEQQRAGNLPLDPAAFPAPHQVQLLTRLYSNKPLPHQYQLLLAFTPMTRTSPRHHGTAYLHAGVMHILLWRSWSRSPASQRQRVDAGDIAKQWKLQQPTFNGHSWIPQQVRMPSQVLQSTPSSKCLRHSARRANAISAMAPTSHSSIG